MLTAPVLTKALDEADTKAPAALIVDLSDVDFVASAAMSVLVIAQENMGTSTRLAVVADGPAASRPLKILGLDSVLNLIRHSMKP
jgi:anti-sigma B factor antagonist